MKLKYFGHASFLIIARNGTRIIVDPYTPGTKLLHAEINEAADVVTVSHGHDDHSNTASIKGSPKVIKGSGSRNIKGVTIQGFPFFHDDVGGKSRGENVVFCFDVDGMRVCHLGDLGNIPADKQLAELGKIDILLIPVGGYFTIDAKQATQVIGKLQPRIVIPMHYKTEKSEYPIAPVDEFIKGRSDTEITNKSEIELEADKLPEKMKIIVLKHSL